jgi:hypothetical protein
MSYRLHIDIPFTDEQNVAIHSSGVIMRRIKDVLHELSPICLTEYNYRLGNDEDRNQKDYLRINGNGHAASGKQRVILYEF